MIFNLKVYLESIKMTDIIINHKENILDSDDQYIAILVSCLAKKLDPKKETILNQVIKKYPYANVYEETANKKKPNVGTYRIVGDGLEKRKILLIYSQIYPGRLSTPQDNYEKRLEWFQLALDRFVSNEEDIKSIAFPANICLDNGGNWSLYYQEIKIFAQTVKLNTQAIDFHLYHGDFPEIPNPKVKQTQISLINCINYNSSISLDSLFIASNQPQVKVNQEKLDPTGKKKKFTGKIKVNLDKLQTRLENPETKKDGQKLVLPDEEPTTILLNQQETPPTDPPKPEPTMEIISDDEDDLPTLTQNASPDISSTQPDDQSAQITSSTPEPSAQSSTQCSSQTTQPSSKAQQYPLELKDFPKTKLNSDWVDPLTLPEINESWFDFFCDPEIQERLKETNEKLRKELEKHGDKVRFLPKFELIFNAFILTDYSKVKVVILGQDPYPNPEHAMGLSFSVPKGEKPAMSLRNIFKELKSNFPEYTEPKDGNLESWAKQGVLLLNSSLTLRQNVSNSHQSYWKATTDTMIRKLSDWKAKENQTLIFMLWGNNARVKRKLIDCQQHYVLESGHPSPMSCKHFFGNNHFKLCNQKLKSLGQPEINWQT